MHEHGKERKTGRLRGRATQAKKEYESINLSSETSQTPNSTQSDAQNIKKEIKFASKF